MMVTIISQCEKKALARTRRVLDAFANRIGDNTWQTVITEEGLVTLKKLLRQTASKNTAISCHWIRSRSRSQLLWVVGNRRRFNHEGYVPVNMTHKKHNIEDWENNWEYLPVIKALTAIAALLHDWGKANAFFQEKLTSSGHLADPLRHEWISCLLLHALVHESGETKNDEAWLTQLANASFDEDRLIQRIQNHAPNKLEGLPPIAQMVAWLIVSHHRLPNLTEKDITHYSSDKKQDIDSIFNSVNAGWGYCNVNVTQLKEQCFKFPNGLLSNSKPWLKALQRWANRLNQVRSSCSALLDNGAWRLVLHHARLSLMLGDHYYSSCDEDNGQTDALKRWQTDIALYANTKRENGQSFYKQFLDQHLVRVCDQSLLVCQSLARFSNEMEFADAPQAIKKKSPTAFAWQDQAAQKIRSFRVSQETKKEAQQGWFVVNMASTGCGKTIANTKIMRALSEDGERLRFILALGLRTLTLQTGEVYRDHIGLDNSELAVLIGSRAVQELHQKSQPSSDNYPSFEDEGSESQTTLLDEDLDYEKSPTAEFLEVLFPKHKAAQAEKNKAFLYKPVLVCTIDHIMAATETKRGGRYILPCLRLLSSDLVIDEIDDFNQKDLIAIGRLIHLAGMLGRKVMISSATIPPALAEGFFHAYQQGWKVHQAFINTATPIACAWVDEFHTEIQRIEFVDNEGVQHYRAAHQKFIEKRLIELKKHPVKRRAKIIPCSDLYQLKGSDTEHESIQQAYFARIQETAIELHHDHHVIDGKTGKKLSFGVVRMANIPPCVALAKYLLQAEWPDSLAPKIMAYHSRQVLLLRHQQEQHLDSVLKRHTHTEKTVKITDPLIRQHLDQATAENVLFILVATPVEEIGRDHCLDWAIIEPSSMRSIIQMAGRVLRHRFYEVLTPNIAIMQYNLRALRDGIKKTAFIRPGYENGSLRLACHDLTQLMDVDQIAERLDASPRIQQAAVLSPKTRLIDLEHQAMNDILCAYDEKGAFFLEGWLSGFWSLTAVPQSLNAFRESQPEITLYYCWKQGSIKFCQKNERGEMVERDNILNIKKDEMIDKENFAHRLWLLERDYEKLLRQRCNFDAQDYLSESDHLIMQKISERYGEIHMPYKANNVSSAFVYSDDFGLLPEK